MGIRNLDAAYSIDQAKVEITKKPDLKDLVGKPFDKLTTTNIHDLGSSVSGTVILLHALADRSPSMLGGSKNIDKFDIQKLYAFQNVFNKEEGLRQLNDKITAMKLVIANFGDQIQDPTTKKFVEDFRVLTDGTQKNIEATREQVHTDTDKLKGAVEQSVAQQADMIAQMEYNLQSFKLGELKADSNNPDRTPGIVDFISSAVDTDKNGRADINADKGAKDWLMRKFNKNRDTGRQGAAFGELQLYNILSNLSAARLGELAKEFTGSETLDANNGKEFNKKLQEKAMNLNNAAQLITGDSKAQGDLFALLNGKQDIYLANLLAQHTANLTKQSTQPGFTQKFQSALEKVGIPTNGQSLLDQSKQFLLAQGASLVYDNAFLSASTKDVNVGSSTHEPLSLQLGKGEVNAQTGLWYGVDLKKLLSGDSPLAIGAKVDFNLNDNISRIINDGKALQDTVKSPINEEAILQSFGDNTDDIYYKQAKEAIAQFNKLNPAGDIKRLAGLLGDLKVNQGVSDSAGWSTKGLTAGINFLSPKFLQLGLTFSKLSQTYETRANEVETAAARATNKVDVLAYKDVGDGLYERPDGIRYQENADKSRIYMFDGQIDFRAIGGGAGLTTKFENGVTLITVPAGKELKVRSTIDNQVNGKVLHRIEIKLVDRKIDATAAQPVAATGPVDVVAKTLDTPETKQIMEALFSSTASLSTVEIRRKYADLQTKAQVALNSGSPDEIQKVMDDPRMRTLLGTVTPSNTPEKAHALESMLGGMSGDWRYRILRAAQAGGNVDMKKVREALYSVKGPSGKIYKVSEVNTLDEVRVAVSKLTMQDMYTMLATKDAADNRNDAFTYAKMNEIGISSDVFDTAKRTYRQSAQGDHLNDTGTTKAGGIGYVINHQVLDGKKEPTFAGRQPVTADSLMRATPPVEFSGQVGRAKFVQSLSPLQMNTLKSGLETALGKADMSMDDIKTALTSNSDVTPKFYYAEYPNCTNAMVIMKLSVKGKPVDLTADFKDELGGTAAMADLGNHETKVTTGANKEIKEKTPPPKPVDDTDTTPGARPVSKPVVTTTPEANANQNSNSNTGGETQNVGQNTSQSLDGASNSVSVPTQTPVLTSAPINTDAVTKVNIPGGFKKG